MSLFENHEIKKTREQYQEVKGRLQKLARKVEQKKILSDTALYERVENIADAYKKQNWKMLESLSLQIYQNLCSNRLIELRQNTNEMLKRIANKPPPNEFPARFNLTGLEIQRGIPVVIGSKTGVGKTTITLNIALEAFEKKQTCVIFSIEMTEDQIWIKLFQLFLHLKRGEKWSFRIVQDWFKNQNLAQDKVEIFRQFKKDIEKYLLIIDADEFSPVKIVNLWDRCEDELAAPIDWAFIDYIQILEHDATTQDDERRQLVHAAKIFKSKAKQTGTTIVLLSQLNEDGEFFGSRGVSQASGLSLIIEAATIDDNQDALRITTTKSRFTSRPNSLVPFNKKTGVIG